MHKRRSFIRIISGPLCAVLVVIPALWGSVASAQSAYSGRFSILDYLDDAEEQKTAEEWAVIGDHGASPEDRYEAYLKAYGGALRGLVSGEASANQVQNLRFALLEAALALVRVGSGSRQKDIITHVHELIREISDPLDASWAYWALSSAEIAIEDLQGAQISISRATQWAQQIETPALKSLIQKSLGLNLLQFGQVEPASYLLREMQAPIGRHQFALEVVRHRAALPDVPVLLGPIYAVILAEEGADPAIKAALPEILAQGYVEPALEVVLTMPDLSEQGDMLRLITTRALVDGQMSIARQSAMLNPDTGEATRAWLEVSRYMREAGYTAQAENALQKALAQANAPSAEPADMVQVAKLRLEMGNIPAAQNLISTLPADDPEVIEFSVRLTAESIRENGGDAAVLDTAQNPEQSDELLAALAVDAAGNRNLGVARGFIESISNAMTADQARRDVSVAFIKHQRLPDAELIAHAIRDPYISALTMGRIAKGLFQNEDPQRGLVLFVETEVLVATMSQSEQDRINRKFAKLLADSGLIDRAESTAMSITDVDLRSEALANIAKPIAKLDPERALRLLEHVSTLALRDKILGEAAIGFAAASNIVEAENAATEISEDSTRVRYMRKIAELQARRLDTSGRLDANTLAPEPISFQAPDIVTGPSFNTTKIFSLPSASLVAQIPPIPQDIWTTGDDVRKDLSPINPGSANVALMRGSYYIEKFISEIPDQAKLRRMQNRHSLEFIMVESGVFDMPALYRQLRNTRQGEQAVERNGRIYTIKLPILIMPGATLVVSGADVESLRLSTENGAFIVVAGDIQLADTVVESWDMSTNQATFRTYEQKKEFRPFITVWSGGVIDAVGNSFFDLGYLSGKSYGLTMSSGPATITKNRPMYEHAATGRIIENSFRNMFYGYYAYEAVGALLIGNEYVDNIVYGLDPHDRARELRIAFNTAYGTQEKHGIIISREVDASWITGNISFSNHGSGFMLDRNSIETTIYANSSFSNNQDGLSLFESSCNIISANWIFGNKRDGIKARNSWNLAISDNTILDNDFSGIDLYSAWLNPEGAHGQRDFELDPYFTFSGAEIFSNEISGHRVGIKVIGVNSLIFGRNGLDRQAPRLFGGDLQALGSSIVRTTFAGGLTAVGNQCAQPVPPIPCSFVERGFLSGEGQGFLPMLEQTNQCIPDSARAPIQLTEESTATDPEQVSP